MKRIDRRQFLGGSVAIAAAFGSRPSLADEKPFIVEVAGSDRAAMVNAALEALGGIGSLVKKGDRVVLKPNLSFANPPDFATTTHPDTLVAVARACLEAGAKDVLVLDNPLQDPDKCSDRNGARAALKSLPGARLRMLADHDEFRDVAIPKAFTLRSTEVAKAVLDADVLINLPQAKAHWAAGVSFGLKNLMGLVWSRKPLHVVHDLHQAIADLGRVIRPQLTILDATQVLTNHGPKGPGDVVEPGKMIAGRAIASVDAWGLTVAPFNGRVLQPTDAKHILFAGRAGLGEFDVAKISVRRVAV